MSESDKPFNPLDKANLGASVAVALLDRQEVRLGEVKPFFGAGIYAVYYLGSFEAYVPISNRNTDDKFEMPIYVGKAVPAGARKGGVGKVGATKSLFKRLQEHAESISLASNLDLQDFWCRYLVVEDIWIPLGESLLISKFSPLWNTMIDGFGNHDPGGGRYEGMRPRWDVLHPGRAWAMKCKDRPETASQVEEEIRSYLSTNPPPAPAHFYAEQRRASYNKR